MKSLNQQELRTFARTVEPFLKGAQLQEVLSNDQGLALGFYRERMLWLLVDLRPATPAILFFQDPVPFQKAQKSKPVSLFLSSHGKNRIFRSLEVQEEWGRVLKIELGNIDSIACEIEIQLIPKQVNFIVRADKKTISWEKPRALKEASPEVDREQRSFEEFHQEWLNENKKSSPQGLDPKAQWEKQRQKDLEKKTKALGEIQKKLSEDQSTPWKKIGEILKVEGFAGVDADSKKYIDTKQSVSWNIENAFQKGKQLAQKKVGTEERMRIIQGEIEALEKAQFRPKSAVAKPADDFMKKSAARGRTLPLPEGATAYIGKSGADNLALLRQAKAWDYWLHLKDYPGAHAIIHRQKNQEISRDEMMQVALWVARESLSSKTLTLGQKLAVVFVECRFVKPIKGDKMGRVTYHSEKNLSVTLDKP
jgi:predicted ribosome quality control (RQC) complex YloA/Tae2 family protein